MNPVNTPTSTEQRSVANPFSTDKIEEFKSIYYLLKGKRDTDIRLFTDNKEFCKEDLTELNDKIQNKISNHEHLTSSLTVTVGLDNKEIRIFGTWAEFVNTDWNISAKTRYITLEWDFNLMLPNRGYSIPQTHTMRVRIGRELRPNDIMQVVLQGNHDEYEFEELNAQVVCKIDFVNSRICTELKNIVQEWYDSLGQNCQDHYWEPKIAKLMGFLHNLGALLAMTAFSIIGYFVISRLISFISPISTDDIIKYAVGLLFIIGPLAYTGYNTGEFISERYVIKPLQKLTKAPMFKFTKGDKNFASEVKAKNVKLMRNVALALITLIASNVFGWGVNKICDNIFDHSTTTQPTAKK